MKRPLYKIVCAFLALAVLALTTGCPRKLEKLKGKAEEAERELQAIDREKAAIQAKIALVRQWEVETPKPTEAIGLQKQEVAREQALVNLLIDKMSPKLDEINKEIKELSDTEWTEVVESGWTNSFPLLKALIESGITKLIAANNALGQNTVQKMASLKNLVSQQVALLGTIGELPPGPQRENALNQLAMAQVQMTQLSFGPEIELAGWMAEQFEFAGAYPVMAGSQFPKTTIFIEEGLPSTLSHLDDGILAPGTEIMLSLPPDWTLTAPITATSSNLTLQVDGNVAGANSVKIKVLGETAAARTNDVIWVTYHGIRVGQQLGIVDSCLFVNPGKVSTVRFCVLPDPPPAFNPPVLQPQGLKLEWQGRGTLQQSPTILGPYTNRSLQDNPQTVPVNDPNSFFRVFRP